MRRTNLSKSNCPVARAMDSIGDWWTVLIVREALRGQTRFNEFQTSLGLAKNILSTRLKSLVANGILRKVPAPEGGPRSEYHLTEKGRRLRVVLTALRQWGEDNLFVTDEPMMTAVDSRQRPIGRLQLLDVDGKRLEPADIRIVESRKGRAHPAPSRTRTPRAR